MSTTKLSQGVKVGLTFTASLGLTCSLALMGAIPAQAAPAPAPTPTTVGGSDVAPGIPALDAQKIDNFDDMTWDDYTEIPNTHWSDPSIQPTVKRWKAAIVLVDYPDMPFQVTQPESSNIWGNPGPAAHDLNRADVPQFYKDLLNTPSPINNYHTINEYWMEDTGGRYGVDITAFGAYQLPKKSYQYHYSSYGNGGSDPTTKCPAALQCNGNFRADALAALKAGTGLADPLAGYDNVFYIGAGADQSSTWLEFGQSKFKSPADIPDEFGPPKEWKDAVKAATGKDAPNWAPTRYVGWTSWASASSMWPNASGNTSIEAESSGAGVYAHEFSHNLNIGDNYGNPYATNPTRDQSGAWDMMSRGSFNGPGGTHERWHVPSNVGSVMGSQHMLRDKMFLNTVPASSVVNVSRSTLAANGVAVTSVTAREVQLPGKNTGVNIVMDGGDKSTCATQSATGDKAWMCDGLNFNNYTLEVVDQMGTDSFTADSGVLLAKTKNTASPNKWVIDANPQDIDMVDYYLADGTAVKVTRGDHRQLNDALFKAGTNSGSLYEYADTANNLKFYVLGKHRDASGILSYDVAVRSLAGSGAAARGVALANPAVSGKTPGQVASCAADLTNTGAAASDPLYSSDVYRLSAAVDGAGWTAALPQEIVAAGAGASTSVSAYAVRAKNAAQTATLTLTATSESDPTKTATVSCALTTESTLTPGTGVQVITASVAGSPLTLKVSSVAPVSLAPVTLNGVDQVATGELHPVQVVDSRGTSAGWDLTGQVSDFTSGQGTILAKNLGWRPAASTYVGTLPTAEGEGSIVHAGHTAAPGSGLGAPMTLCGSAVGQSSGSFTCSGGLDLGIPGSARLGTYTGVLTMTLI